MCQIRKRRIALGWKEEECGMGEEYFMEVGKGFYGEASR